MEKGCLYFDGVGKGKGGLCDRLKGMYSCYNLALNLNKDFYYNIPFPVALNAKKYKNLKNDDFYELNILDYDNYNSLKTKITNLDFPLQNYKIHTNMNFVDDLKIKIKFSDFMDDFFDLKKFEIDHNVFKFDIGIHIRYGGITVDWSDSDFGSSFDENTLISRIKNICLDKNKEFYFCSDSKKILDMVDSLNIKNLTTSPTIPRHTDRSNDVKEEDYINSFIDLLTLSNCELIYSTNGEFAKTASKIYNKKIENLF